MTHALHTQRGEGRIGCIIALVVLVLAGAVAFRAVPVIYSNSELSTECKEMGVKAGILPLETIQRQLLSKAKDLEIPEAMVPGAITVTKNQSSGDVNAGVCRISLRYSRKIDFYGVYTYTLDKDETISMDYMDVR